MSVVTASPAEVLQAMLVAQGLALLPTGPPPDPRDPSYWCFVSSSPDEYDRLVMLRDVAGRDFGKNLRSQKEMIHPGVVALFRSLDYSGYSQAVAVCQYLDAVNALAVSVSGVLHYVQSVYRTSGIIALGEEVDKKRQQWVVNFRVAYQDAETFLG